MRKIEIIFLSMICSAIISAVISKIMATHYFLIIDGHVEDIMDKIKDLISTVKRKLE